METVLLGTGIRGVLPSYGKRVALETGRTPKKVKSLGSPVGPTTVKKEGKGVADTSEKAAIR